MPYLEVFAPAASDETKARFAREATQAVIEAFAVKPETVTLYFLDIPVSAYAHAGQFGAQAGRFRIFLKVHAYRRGVDERRAAAKGLTQALCDAYGAEGRDIGVYFLDRERDEVAHDFHLASDENA